MDPLSLALFVHDLDVQVGGMERQAAQIATRFARRGHRVRALTWPKGAAERPRRELRDGVEILRFKERSGIPAAVSGEGMTLQMAAALYRRPPQVLYAIHYRGAVHASAFRDLFGVPVAVKLACSGYFGDFQTAARCGDQAGIQALLGADALVCLNQEVEREALAAGARPSQLVRIRNGVEIERYAEAAPCSRESLGLSEEALPLLFVGRLAEQKRLDILIEAVAEALRVLPQLVLLLAGEGPEREALEAKANACGINDRVRFLGARSDVPSLLRSARAFVLPSCSEGISNALLEALSAGVPVVVSRIPGNLEVVGEDAGLLVEVDSVESLRDAITATFADPDAAAARVAAGRRRLQAEFALATVTTQYEDLFRQLSRSKLERRRLGFLRRATRASIPFAIKRARYHSLYRLGLARARVSEAVVGVKRSLGIEDETGG